MQVVLQILPWVLVVLGVIVFVMFAKWMLSLRRVVKPSEVHVVRRSKKTEVYGDIQKLSTPVGDGQTKGDATADVAGNSYYAIPSWMPIWGVEVQVLPLANFSVDLNDYEAYDKDRLPFMVDVTAFFRIADYRQAASRIESNKTLTEHLKKIVQSAVRSILANDSLDEIMGQRAIYGDKFTTEVKNNLREWGIVPVKSIELMDVRDKSGEKVIDNIMKKRKSFIERESRIEVAKNQQAAREEEIKAEQAVALKEQEKEQIVGERTADRERAVGIAKEKAQQEIQEQARETKSREMEVIKVETVRQAEIDKEKLIVDSKAKKEAGQIDAETKVLVAERGKIAAEHDAEALLIKTKKDAEGRLAIAQNEAEGIKAKGLAEAEAKEKSGLAEVQPQITLAKEIGENEGYQTYLIEVKKVEASQAVGIEQAKNLSGAQIKIVANAGNNVQEGVTSVMDLFSAKGGQALGSMLETFAGTEQGQALLSKIFGKKNEPKPTDASKGDKK